MLFYLPALCDLLARFLCACCIKRLTMKLTDEQVVQLRGFFKQSYFATHGAVITDLDGTAVHEYEGKAIIHESVEVCLLYTSDAADERSSVDLGGRRII